MDVGKLVGRRMWHFKGTGKKLCFLYFFDQIERQACMKILMRVG